MGDYVNGHMFNAQVQKISMTPPPPPTEGTFAFDPLTPLPPNFHFRGCLSYSPPSGISVIFQLGLVPSGKNIFYVKNVVALYYYAKEKIFLQ